MDPVMSFLWLGLIVLFAIVEAINPQLLSIWFAGGAIAGLIVALLGGPLWLQFTLFVAVSAILLLATRPLARKFLSGKAEKTNADRNIGKTGIVIEQIDNQNEKGQVRVSGQIWTARSESGEVIAEGQTVTVLRIEGVKLIVNAL